MIDVINLSFRYSTKSGIILNNLSFHIDDADILCILGQNGIGKTTLLKCITGEFKTYDGHVIIDEKTVPEYSISELARKIAIVASNNVVYQDLCVADYLLTGLASRIAPFGGPRKEQYEGAYAALDSLGKGELFNRSMSQLSSGELQIIKMARAIVQDPQIILFDEPTSNLDVNNQLLVIDRITLLSQRGYTVITTTHNPGQAIELNGKVLLFFPDQTYLFGNEKELITADNLTRMYGLESSVEEDSHRRYAVFSSRQKLHDLFY